MKNIIKLVSFAVVSSILISCVQDLNTLPLNPTDTTSETAYVDEASYLKGLAYINAYWVFVSQNSQNSSDISVDDAGQSELARQYMVLQEMSADSFKCVWGDAYVAGIQQDLWTSTDNAAIIAVYTRCMKGITLANEYLLQTEDEKIKSRGHEAFAGKIAQYRAEARFHRAMYYYLMLDFFGNPPFVTPDNIGGDLPEQISRADLYKWIEEECLDLVSANSAMPNYGTVPYPRPTKGSVYAILARLYLNAQVYTGTPQWQKAKDACAEIIKMGYKLHANYGEMFMQDNTTNGSAEEFIFAIDYDKTHAQSWGGTTALICGGLSNTDSQAIGKYLGITQNSEGKATNNLNQAAWTGYHVSDEYVSKFNLVGVTWDTPTDGSSLGYDRDKSDKRAFFFNGGRTQKFVLTNHKTGWVCWKFSCLNSDGTTETGTTDATYSSADVPIFRLGEIYLTYAEADARLNGGVVTDATAKGYIKALRDRAGVSMPADNELTTDWLLEERARELMWEGCRRTDLIRYGYFTSMNYPWPYKGGVEDGNVALDEYRTIYPIIMDDLNANKNLTQNPGY